MTIVKKKKLKSKNVKNMPKKFKMFSLKMQKGAGIEKKKPKSFLNKSGRFP